MRACLYVFSLLLMLCFLTGCKENTAPTVENLQENTPFIVLASDDYTNLHLNNPGIPVYDPYTRKERIDKGLSLSLPTLRRTSNEQIVYLTFDDGPDSVNTPQILDILHREGVPATFYVVGKNVEAHPDVLRRIYREHHAIGNHSYDHDYNTVYASPESFLASIDATDMIIHRILGVRPLILRAPGGETGNFTPAYRELLTKNGYASHDWNMSNGDATGEAFTAAALLENVRTQLASMTHASSIILLMHASGTQKETVDALPGIIRLFKDRGYHFGVITPMTPKP
ncbi:hypothetical protein TAMA11512_11510 [Selenomonas sp. TAMA-11512]|uniref:polysaccharide deacetylase family protein n=1 Tax=Selenomonas sp. TAMA-11512 TaxID=3095337 RepID=UPI00308C7ABF|nr:hypothetical protein TAMA11512_11510 [Selenomonas sp. TAMA-11512]